MPTEVQIYKDGTVVAADLADKTITAEKIADATITDAKIADKTITAAKITDKTITDAKIADATITAGKLSPLINFFPVGGIIMWSGTTAPAGWQLCNGTDLPSDSSLRPIITKTPDLRDRFIVGAGSGYAVAATGGAASVTLDENQIPSHNHTGTSTITGTTATVSSGNSNTNPNLANISATNTTFLTGFRTASYGRAGGGANVVQDWGYDGGIPLITTNIGNAGGGLSHENRPPYYALAFIMKT